MERGLKMDFGLHYIDTFDSPAQAFTSEDGVPNARGRVLGGSSAINQCWFL